jgi:hypothetical protein
MPVSTAGLADQAREVGRPANTLLLASTTTSMLSISTPAFLPPPPEVYALQTKYHVPYSVDAGLHASWDTVLGRSYIYEAVKASLPQWDRFREFQIPGWSTALARKNLFAILATGSGKTSLFYGPIFVARYYKRHPTPSLRALPLKPVMLVVVPLVEIANNHVSVTTAPFH